MVCIEFGRVPQISNFSGKKFKVREELGKLDILKKNPGENSIPLKTGRNIWVHL